MARQIADIAGSGRDRPRRQLRGPATAAEVADQVDPRHARSVRRRDRAAGIDVRRRHHAARHRSDSRRREFVVPRRIDEREEPVHADEGTGADPRIRLQRRRRASSSRSSNFSIAVNGQNNYTTPNLNVATADAARRFDVLSMRQPFEVVNINATARLRAHEGPDAAIRLLAEQQRAGQPGHRRLRPAGARVQVRPRTGISSARSRPARSAGGASSTRA